MQEKLTGLSSDKRRVAYLAEAADVTGLERDGKYDYCPISDNGAGLLSNARLSPWTSRRPP